MAREALKTFGMVMDNTADIKNIVINNFFKSLDLGNNDLLNEFVMEKLSDFNFCIVQDKFISKIQETINQEFKKIENANGTIDYEEFQNSLISNLQQVILDDIRLEDDIRNLSLQISDKFSMISRDAIFEKLSSKQENLKEVILSTNKNVIDTLVNMTPQLVQDLKQLEVENQNKSQTQQLSQNINNLQQQNKSEKTINLHDVIQQIRKNIISKSKAVISTIQSPNPFNEFNPVTIEQFQDEINKYGIDVDRSYIEGVVYQINFELYRDLINIAKENIINDVVKSTNYKIDLLKIEDIVQNYKFKLNEEDMVEIIQYVNNRIIDENRKRPEINLNENQQVKIEQDSIPSLETSQQQQPDLFENDSEYKRLYELANSETKKDAIRKILTTGEFNGFKLNSMLSNKKDNVGIERKRRIKFAKMILLDENLFLNLANNGLNCFHGTRIDALETILNNGLLSSRKLHERGIDLKTGEEKIYSSKLDELYGPINPEYKRNFISLTDDFDASASYAGFRTKEQIETFKNNYGEELKNEPIIICFNGNDIAKKYSDSLANVESMYTEIGITSSLSPLDIKCIITSPEKLKEVQSIVSKYGIKVLEYDCEKYSKLNNLMKENSNISIDEIVGPRTSDNYSEMITELENSQNKIEQATNNLTNDGLLNDDLSMKIASDVKMDIVFNLTEQYNTTGSFISITPNDLISRYNMNEKIAQNLAQEINSLVGNYSKEKETQMQNYTPYVLDGFEEEQEVSHKHR